MGPKQTAKKKGKAKAPMQPLAVVDVEEIVLDPAPQRGGEVPPMVVDPPLESVMKAKDLVTAWQLHGSQAVWKMTCLIEMEKKKSLMLPLDMKTDASIGTRTVFVARPMDSLSA